ncbi:GDSL esterase/lipase At4g28780-like [Arachis ipaensis]|uniref:GDSL esterase/lipase At4g28780-like n=1 Tax=Arachis ipaensis TaxID=130454 RepID=UPI000A2B4166|nr:GDSL esterase/lipase At4g28780-like [Arachis ipaensis]
MIITMHVIIIIMRMVMMAVPIEGGETGRAFFVFGDSLVDSGNNNYLPTTARADTLPYGVDYPTHHPTGRFSNGFNLPDLISQRIGSEAALPYLSPEMRGQNLLLGANFASAGVGILKDTGIQFEGILRIYQQFALFQQYQERLGFEVGAAEAERIVNGSLVLITLGSNDFVNNYFYPPNSARSLQFTIPKFCSYVISEYRKILMVILRPLPFIFVFLASCYSLSGEKKFGFFVIVQRLYELGGRKVLVTGTGPLGCIPSQLAERSINGECVAQIQEASQIFNQLLIKMTTELNNQLTSPVFIVVNAFRINMEFINHPQRFGFVSSKIACCGQGRFNGIGGCTSFSSLCSNRDLYVFWDSFHPSQHAWEILANYIFNGTTNYMSPMNLTTILAMDSNFYK